MNPAEEILNRNRRFVKARVRRYCPGWDGKQHPVDNPDGKRPGELCKNCIDHRARLPQ